MHSTRSKTRAKEQPTHKPTKYTQQWQYVSGVRVAFVPEPTMRDDDKWLGSIRWWWLFIIIGTTHRKEEEEKNSHKKRKRRQRHTIHLNVECGCNTFRTSRSGLQFCNICIMEYVLLLLLLRIFTFLFCDFFFAAFLVLIQPTTLDFYCIAGSGGCKVPTIWKCIEYFFCVAGGSRQSCADAEETGFSNLQFYFSDHVLLTHTRLLLPHRECVGARVDFYSFYLNENWPLWRCQSEYGQFSGQKLVEGWESCRRPLWHRLPKMTTFAKFLRRQHCRRQWPSLLHIS